MPIMEWNPRFGIGVHNLDAELRLLFNRFNAIYDYARNEGTNAQIQDSLRSFHEHLLVYFATEETMMEAEGYPEFENHRRAHRRLLKGLQSVQTRMETGDPGVREMIAESFNNWLSEDFFGPDRGLAEFLRLKSMKHVETGPESGSSNQ